MSTLMVDSVVADMFFCRFILSRQIDGDEPRAGEDKLTKKCSRHYRSNHLTSINVDI